MGTTAATQEVAPDRRESEPRRDPRPSPPGSVPRPVVSTRNSRQCGAAESAGARRKKTEAPGTIRYFLTKTTSNGAPELGQEMPDEHQALIAALKQDRSFVSVKEWRAKVDIKKGAPVIEKDPVVRE